MWGGIAEFVLIAAAGLGLLTAIIWLLCRLEVRHQARMIAESGQPVGPAEVQRLREAGL